MSVSKRFRAKKLTVSFYVSKEASKEAVAMELLCEHNGWEPVAMKKQSNGTYRGSITVDRGVQDAYQYRFKLTYADGTSKYDNDWNADDYVANPFGGENSIFYAKQDEAEENS